MIETVEVREMAPVHLEHPFPALLPGLTPSPDVCRALNPADTLHWHPRAVGGRPQPCAKRRVCTQLRPSALCDGVPRSRTWTGEIDPASRCPAMETEASEGQLRAPNPGSLPIPPSSSQKSPHHDSRPHSGSTSTHSAQAL